MLGYDKSVSDLQLDEEYENWSPLSKAHIKGTGNGNKIVSPFQACSAHKISFHSINGCRSLFSYIVIL